MDFIVTSASLATSGLALTALARNALRGLQRRQSIRRWRSAAIDRARHDAETAFHNAVLRKAPSTTAAGPQWRVLEVAQIVAESADCKSFYLVDPQGQPLPAFHPGQHVMVRPPMAYATGITRCYSLSTSPNPHYWRITVKREVPVDWRRFERLEGNLSYWMHEVLSPGDCLWVAGPQGTFYLPPQCDSPLVLAAAGVGITPMISMIRWSLQHRPTRPITLFYQAKDRDHWPFGELLHRWSTQFDQLQVATYFSRETSQDLVSLDQSLGNQVQSGRFSAAELFAALGDTGVLYLCGPQQWRESLQEGLIDEGIAPSRIHWESFSSATKPNASNRSQEQASTVSPYAVKFSRSNVEATWHSAVHSLWELAQEHAVGIPSGCLSGVCGCCKTRLVAGQVEYDREPGVELAADECLTCISRPLTSVILDA